MRRFVTTLLALGVVVGCSLGFVVALLPGPAWAHDALRKTTPTDGTTVARVPVSVTLEFTEQPLPMGMQVVVTGPAGDVARGAPVVSGRVVSQPVLDTAPAGAYVVTFRVTSDDGHPISGAFSFSATTGLDGSTAPAEPTSVSRATSAAVGAPAGSAAPDGGSTLVPIVVSILGTGALVAVVALGVVRARHRD